MSVKSQNSIAPANIEVSLKEIVLKIQQWCRFLLSRALIILIVGLSGGFLGLFYAMTKKPIYTATTTFVLEDEKGVGGLGSLASVASMAGIDISGSGGGMFQGDNILELYKSRKMLQKTLLTEVVINDSKQTLANRYITFNNLRENWIKRPELLSLNFSTDTIKEGHPYLRPTRLRDSILTIIINDIALNYLTVAKLDKRLSIIKVDVKSQDESFSKVFNEAIVKNVNNFYLQTKVKKSLQNVQNLQHKTDSVRGIMNGAIITSAAVLDATPNLNPTRQALRIAPTQKAGISVETNKAILGALVQSLEMSKLALMKETPLLEVIDQPVYPLTQDRFGKIKGFLIGYFLSSVLVIFFISVKRIIHKLLSE
jgi:hypothetical protein